MITTAPRRVKNDKTRVFARKARVNLDFDITEDMGLDMVADDSILIMGIISLFNKYSPNKIKFDDFKEFKSVKDILDKGGFN